MLVEKEWLLNNLHNKKIRIVDCRFNLQNTNLGTEQYGNDHLPNAVYFDLAKDLSGVVEKHGGRHPLPNLLDFKEKLSNAGIRNDDIIVAYDGGEGSYAGRFLWLMKYIGHDEVYVLNGGYKHWKEAGYPLENRLPLTERSDYELSVQTDMLASYEEVKKLSETRNNSQILIDSRDSIRYSGIEEPIDKKPGHIPGAINIPWTEGFQDGLFKTKESQQDRFKTLDPNKDIIVYCGSGVTATPNYMALKEAGFQNVKVYIGSYSDWVSYDENPVEKTMR